MSVWFLAWNFAGTNSWWIKKNEKGNPESSTESATLHLRWLELCELWRTGWTWTPTWTLNYQSSSQKGFTFLPLIYINSCVSSSDLSKIIDLGLAVWALAAAGRQYEEEGNSSIILLLKIDILKKNINILGLQLRVDPSRILSFFNLNWLHLIKGSHTLNQANLIWLSHW